MQKIVTILRYRKKEDKMSEVNSLLSSLAQTMNTNEQMADNINNTLDSALLVAKEAAAKANALLSKANADALVYASVPAELVPKETYSDLL
ncbi:MAG: hypothetical protein PHF25_03845 [Candidatus Margulisbacteria bacterium]|nr:hypothetical protein [Candidatus Margulisiibacteriota bacterium]